MTRFVVRRDRRTREDVSTGVLGVIVHVAPDLVPDALDQMPFIYEVRPLAVKQQTRFYLAGSARHLVPVEPYGALRRLEGGLRLATGARSLDEHGPGRAKTTGQFLVGQPGQVIADSPEGVFRR